VALDKNPARRYPTALALAEDLRRICEYEPVQARPAGIFLRLARWARRSPGIASGLVGLFSVLVVGLSISLVLLAEVQSALDLAEGRRLREASVEMLKDSPSAALTLALEANQRAPGPQAVGVIYEPLLRSRMVGRISPQGAATISGWALIPHTQNRIAVIGRNGLLAVQDYLEDAEPWSLKLFEDKASSNVRPYQLEVCANGQVMAVSSSDGELVLLEAEASGTWRTRWHLSGSGDVSRDFCFDREGTRLAVLPVEGPGYLLNCRDGERLLTFDSALSGAQQVEWLASGDRLCLSTMQGSDGPGVLPGQLWILDAESGVVQASLGGQEDPLLGFHIQGDLLAVSTETKAQVLQSVAGELRLVGAVRSLPKDFVPGAVSLDAAQGRLALVGPQGVLIGEGQSDWLQPSEDAARMLAWSPDGSQLLVAESGQSLKLFSHEGALLGEDRDYLRPQAILWPSSGSHYLAVGRSPHVHVFSARRLGGAFLLETSGAVIECAAFFGDGLRVALGDRSGEVRVCSSPRVPGEQGSGDREPGRLLWRSVLHRGAVNQLALARQAGSLHTFGADGRALAFDSDGNLIGSNPPHTRPLLRGAVSDDGRHWASIDDQGSLQLWSVDGMTAPHLNFKASALCFDNTANVLIVGGDGSHRVGLDLATLETLWSREGREGSTIRILDLQFWQDELLARSSDNRVRFIDRSSGEISRQGQRMVGSDWLHPTTHGFVIGRRAGASGVRIQPIGGGPNDGNFVSLPLSGRLLLLSVDASGEVALASASDGGFAALRIVDGTVLCTVRDHGENSQAIFDPSPGPTRWLTFDQEGRACVLPLDPLAMAQDRFTRPLDDWERNSD
jgi:WD40 repeat protein